MNPFSSPLDRAERIHSADLGRVAGLETELSALPEGVEDAFEIATQRKALTEKLAIAREVAEASAARLAAAKAEQAHADLLVRKEAQEKTSARLAAKVSREWPKARAALLELVEALKADAEAVRLLEIETQATGILGVATAEARIDHSGRIIGQRLWETEIPKIQ